MRIYCRSSSSDDDIQKRTINSVRIMSLNVPG